MQRTAKLIELTVIEANASGHSDYVPGLSMWLLLASYLPWCHTVKLLVLQLCWRVPYMHS